VAFFKYKFTLATRTNIAGKKQTKESMQIMITTKELKFKQVAGAKKRLQLRS